MIKSYMSDNVLIQPPLLCYPEAFLASTESYFNSINGTSETVVQSLDEERIAELQDLSVAISKDFPSMERTVRYYQSIVDMERARQPFTKLGFIDAGPIARNGLANVQVPERPPEPRNHWLQVVFHHSRGG